MRGQAITEEYIADNFPGWMARIARDLGDFDLVGYVVWL